VWTGGAVQPLDSAGANSIIGNNKTRQGYAFLSTLKPAGYFLCDSPFPLSGVHHHSAPPSAIPAPSLRHSGESRNPSFSCALGIAKEREARASRSFAGMADKGSGVLSGAAMYTFRALFALDSCFRRNGEEKMRTGVRFNQSVLYWRRARTKSSRWTGCSKATTN